VLRLYDVARRAPFKGAVLNLASNARHVSFNPANVDLLSFTDRDGLAVCKVSKSFDTYELSLIRPQHDGGAVTRAGDHGPSSVNNTATSNADALLLEARRPKLWPVEGAGTSANTPDRPCRWLSHCWVSPTTLAASSAQGDVIVAGLKDELLTITHRLRAAELGIHGPLASVTCLAATRDYLVAGCSDGTVRFLAQAHDYAVARVCELTVAPVASATLGVTPAAAGGDALPAAAAALTQQPPPPPVWSLATAPSFGTLYACTTAGTLHVLQVQVSNVVTTVIYTTYVITLQPVPALARHSRRSSSHKPHHLAHRGSVASTSQPTREGRASSAASGGPAALHRMTSTTSDRDQAHPRAPSVASAAEMPGPQQHPHSPIRKSSIRGVRVSSAASDFPPGHRGLEQHQQHHRHHRSSSAGSAAVRAGTSGRASASAAGVRSALAFTVDASPAIYDTHAGGVLAALSVPCVAVPQALDPAQVRSLVNFVD
jgi:hypothetical protein